MFQFCTFAPQPLYIQGWVSQKGWVAPFGHPQIAACLPAPCGFSQVTTSFFASRRQDIHRVPLWPGRTNRTPRPPPPGSLQETSALACKGDKTPAAVCLRQAPTYLSALVYKFGVATRLQAPMEIIPAAELHPVDLPVGTARSPDGEDIVSLSGCQRWPELANPSQDFPGGISDPGLSAAVQALVCALTGLVSVIRRGSLVRTCRGSSCHTDFSTPASPSATTRARRPWRLPRLLLRSIDRPRLARLFSRREHGLTLGFTHLGTL
jgi:hypothetical protein